MLNEQSFLDFLTTLGRETCEVLGRVVGSDFVEPHDGYEIFIPVCGRRFDSSDLQALDQEQIDVIRDKARTYFEYSKIESTHVRQVIDRTVSHWPAGDPWRDDVIVC